MLVSSAYGTFVRDCTYVDLAASVVLDDLVGSVESAATDDPRHITGPVLLL
jgi:hypothetical protein